MSLKGGGGSLYDWGGLSREEKMLNVTRFKEEFGGEEEPVYYYMIMRI